MASAAEHAPAWLVRGAVVKERWSAGAGVTLSVWPAEARPAADADTATLPGAVPRKKKVAVVAFAGMVGAAGVVQAASAKKAKPAAGTAESPTGVAPETGAALPKASRASIVATPEHAPAATVWGAVAKARRSGTVAWICWSWLAPARPDAVAFTVTVPTLAPLKYAPAKVAPAPTVTPEAGVVHVASE